MSIRARIRETTQTTSCVLHLNYDNHLVPNKDAKGSGHIWQGEPLGEIIKQNWSGVVVTTSNARRTIRRGGVELSCWLYAAPWSELIDWCRRYVPLT